MIWSWTWYQCDKKFPLRTLICSSAQENLWQKLSQDRNLLWSTYPWKDMGRHWSTTIRSQLFCCVHSQCERKKQIGLWKIIRSWQIFTSKTGPIFVFERVHPLVRDVLRFWGWMSSRHAVCITSDPSSIVMKNCPFPISFKKPASEHSFDNFWSSGSPANFLSYSTNLVPMMLNSEMRRGHW